jgi:uncharacterized membrane protein
MKHEFLRKPRKLREVKKNYVPAILMALLFWGLLGLMMVFVDPTLIENFILPGTYFLFFILLFLALFFTTSLLLSSSRRGFLIGLGICGGLFLRLKYLGNVINLSLLIIFLVLLELYWGGKGVNKKTE